MASRPCLGGGDCSVDLHALSCNNIFLSKQRRLPCAGWRAARTRGAPDGSRYSSFEGRCCSPSRRPRQERCNALRRSRRCWYRNAAGGRRERARRRGASSGSARRRSGIDFSAVYNTCCCRSCTIARRLSPWKLLFKVHRVLDFTPAPV